MLSHCNCVCVCVCVCVVNVKVLVAQFCPALCDPIDYSPPCSSVQGVLQARFLEWAAASFSRRSSLPRDWTQVSCISSGFFVIWAPSVCVSSYHTLPNISTILEISSGCISSLLLLLLKKALSCVRLFASPWAVACDPPLSWLQSPFTVILEPKEKVSCLNAPVCMLSHFRCVWLFVTPWSVACQALLSMRFSKQE